ncbi:MAG: DegT/DnrJ/EryC1/StrS family aminotransferase [Phycisphaerales bacterium]|jgi:dTDP-4-amino-4,6-dideoxygalactose transaminase|nr:DegT/DnrJ/EryC1/StrS family aminotransferase [Phycisphaerales bacterium]
MTMQVRSIPFLALGGLFEQDDVQAATRVIAAAAGKDGSFFPQPEEADFQNAFAAHEGATGAVAVNSCGTALDVCMMVLGIKPGDEVITTPLTFVCTATCAIAQGAKVVFADVDRQTLCLDPEAVRRKITPKTKAIIPTHFAGHPADIEAFDRLSRDSGVPVIYDAAHAVGATFNGKPIGGAAKASCYSFQSNKNMTTLGEGGAITSADPEFLEQARRKKTFGYVYGKQLRVASIGFNYRMTKPQLAVGLTQLAKAARVNAIKREKFRAMSRLLAGVGELTLPAGFEGEGHGAHLYVLRLDTDKAAFTRDALRTHLKDKHGVATSLHYPAVWTWEAFDDLEYDRSDCRQAERACEQVVSLPIFPQTSDDDLNYIAWAIKQSLTELK